MMKRTVSMSTKKAKKQNRKTNISMSAKDIKLQLKKGLDSYMAGHFDKAQEYWLPLAEVGDSEAEAWIGSLYANGDGVEINDSTAFKWYLRSAEGGNVQAQNNVGAMYAMGNGINKNLSKSVVWFERAAKAGDPNSQFNLACLLSDSTSGDIEKDLSAAAKWYRSAAENGHYPSQARLGHMYSIGQGIKKDRVQAYVWLSLAAQHGIGTALNALEALAKQMSTEEKSEAMNLFELWRGKTAGNAGPSRITPLPA